LLAVAKRQPDIGQPITGPKIAMAPPITQHLRGAAEMALIADIVRPIRC
jgi:hypothetical protein